jgi:magnesium transporter
MASEEKFTCQLFHYNDEAYQITKNTPTYYADNFLSEEIENNPKNQIHWLNFHSISERENIEKLAHNLSIDKLTIEDLYEKKQRPKLEEYQNYLFFSVKSALIKKSNSGHLKTETISFIMKKNLLISFQEKKSDHFTSVRDRIEKNKGKIRLKGADFLLFRMLEAVTDNYFEVLDDIVATIEQLEVTILSNSQSDTLKRIELEKRKLVELRKVVFPLKEITSQLDKSESNFIEKENNYYFSELKDSCLTVLEEIDSNKQILEGLANLYYAVQGQKMNEIMKLLTVVSAIFIPLTFIAGIYGMNFEYIPETRNKNGFFFVIGGMVLLAIILIFYFKRRGWLKR